MNLQDFTGYLHDPYQPVHQKKEDLHDLSLRFPYCSSIQVLYSLLLFSENDLEFNTQLKKTAAYLPGRKRLKELLDGFNTPVEEPRSAADDTLEPEAMIPDPVSEIRHPGPTVTRNDLMDRVKKRLEEIKREKEGAELPAMTARESPEQSNQMSKADIMERFIREEPRITFPKTSFYRPSESALKSNLEETDIVSETLARLYLEQGSTAKAIRVYEKLSLLFPEKSRYFAAQIKKIG